MNSKELHDSYRTARADKTLTVLEGFHAIKHAIRFNANIQNITSYDQSDFFTLINSHAPDIRKYVYDVCEYIPESEFRSLSPHTPGTGCLAIALRKSYSMKDIELRADRDTVVLERPTHPENVGAVIRVAAAANIAGVILLGAPEIDPWSPHAIRSAAGLQFALPVISCDVLPNIDGTCISMDENGEDLFAYVRTKILQNESRGNVFIFGSEREGVSKKLKTRADMTLRIPMKNGVSSMNLATSVAALLYSLKAQE